MAKVGKGIEVTNLNLAISLVLPKNCSAQLSRMEMETTDSRGEEEVYHRVAMDDEVFKEHVKTLDQMYVQTFHDI